MPRLFTIGSVWSLNSRIIPAILSFTPDDEKNNMSKLSALAVLPFLLFLSFSSHSADQTINIKFSHVSSEDSPKGQGALLFKKMVDERLKGKVTVEIFPQSSLMDDGKGLEALRNNEIQMMAPSLAKFSAYTPLLQIYDLPFLFDDLTAVDQFQSRAKGRQLLLSMEEQNIIGLAYWHNGMKQLSATRPLHSPQEATGLTFRIQPSPVLEAQFAAVGAKTLETPFSAMRSAIATGQVQGAENPWSNFDAEHLADVQPYITESNHGVLDYMVVTNPRFWYGMPHEIRMELENILANVTYEVNRQSEAEDKAHRQAVLNSGKVQLITLTAEQRKAWRDAMKPVWDQFRPVLGERLLKAAEAAN